VTNNLEWALRYADELNWPVLPLARGEKLPAIAKRNGGNGVHDASVDPDQIREWGRLYPNANVGIACGEVSGIFIVDVDPRNGGDVSLAALTARGYLLPNGPKQRTGNGGWHIGMRWEPGIANSKGRLGPGIEIKSTGGYIVAAPSWTRKSDNGPGGFYEWIVSPFETPVPRAPMWLQAMLKPKPRTKIEFRGLGSDSNIDGLIRRVASEPEGNRNPMLYWATCRAEENGSATGTNIGRLVTAACHAGLTQSEAMKTVNSAISRVRNERGAR
jgi:hypothetical protein